MSKYTEQDDRYVASYKKTWVGQVIAEEKTDCAVATIIQTPDFGEVVLLDGEVQSSAEDEKLYHTVLTAPALRSACGGRPRTACILGGGEGCTARELLAWPTIQHVDQVDYDRAFVQFCRKNLWHWTDCVYADSRLNVEYADAWKVIKQLRKYDLVCVDLTDFDITSGQEIYKKELDRAVELLEGATMWLNPGGALTMYCALDSRQTDRFLQDLQDRLQEAVPGAVVHVYRQYIPSFAGEAYFLLVTI
jgi:spermidine synthase